MVGKVIKLWQLVVAAKVEKPWQLVVGGEVDSGRTGQLADAAITIYIREIFGPEYE